MDIATSCTRDCPCGCSILVGVEDGRIVSHRADPRNPVTGRFLCVKGNKYLKRFYSPERILTPLRRKDGAFSPLSWEQALDLAAEKLTRSRQAYGALSTLWAQYSGSLSLLNLFMPRIFWIHFGGATSTRGGISIDALMAAQEQDFGACLVHEPADLLNARHIVIWGRNPAVTHVHLMPFIKEARKSGAVLTVIDPRRTETARLADRHIAPRPGSDGYLAIALAREIRRRQGETPGFVKTESTDWQGYFRLLDDHDDESLLKKADVSAEQVSYLASCYWDEKPCATFLGLGINWWKQGGAHSRLIDALIFLSGNVGLPGGGANFFNMVFPFGANVFREEVTKARARGVQMAQQRRILLPLLGREIEKAQEPPIRTAWFAMFNPVATAPDSNHLKKVLADLDFVIVNEQFMTATARRADLVLPVTTYLEENDVMYFHGSSYMGPVNAAVPPLGEARSNMWIFQNLANRLGFGQALAGEPWDWIARAWSPLQEQGITIEAVKNGPVRRKQPHVPFEDRVFATPDGKFQFIDSYDEKNDSRGGLFLVMVKKQSFLNSQLLEEEADELPQACLNPATLLKAGLRGGDRIWLYNSLDQIEARAMASDHTRPDVVELSPSMWKDDQGGINRLRPALLSDMGPTAAVNETKVFVKKA